MNKPEETSPLDSLVSLEEVAQACFVTQQTIRNWMDRGIMPPAIRIGRRCLRWRADDIQAWLTENQSKPQTEKV